MQLQDFPMSSHNQGALCLSLLSLLRPLECTRLSPTSYSPAFPEQSWWRCSHYPELWFGVHGIYREGWAPELMWALITQRRFKILKLVAVLSLSRVMVWLSWDIPGGLSTRVNVGASYTYKIITLFGSEELTQNVATTTWYCAEMKPLRYVNFVFSSI